MTTPEVPSNSATTPAAPPGYGDALMEAARRQPRSSTYGETGGTGDSGRPGSRPSAVRPASPSTPVTRPTPMPKRPKGRLFVAATLLTIGGVVVFAVWDSLLRYSAHGVISGRTVNVAGPWPGVLRTLHVREGDEVRQGDMLATIVNLELKQKAETIADNLRIAQADLEAELVKLRFESLSRDDLGQQALSDYYAMWGELAQEQSKLASLIAKRVRSDAMNEKMAVSQAYVDEIRFSESGLRSKIEKMTLAVEELKRRVDRSNSVPRESQGQLRPFLTRINVLQEQLVRTREQVRQGEVRSPVNGRVIQTYRFSGEYADEGQSIVQILIDGSVEAIIYVPQDSTNEYPVGKTIELIIPPITSPIEGTVVRIGDELKSAPQHLKRYFHAETRLLPVHVKIATDETQGKLKLGGEVKLPVRYSGFSKYISRGKTPEIETVELSP